MMHCTLTNTNMIGSKECTTGKAKNTVKRYTLYSATPIGANAMFVQIGQRYTPFFGASPIHTNYQ